MLDWLSFSVSYVTCVHTVLFVLHCIMLFNQQWNFSSLGSYSCIILVLNYMLDRRFFFTITTLFWRFQSTSQYLFWNGIRSMNAAEIWEITELVNYAHRQNKISLIWIKWIRPSNQYQMKDYIMLTILSSHSMGLCDMADK